MNNKKLILIILSVAVIGFAVYFVFFAFNIDGTGGEDLYGHNINEFYESDSMEVNLNVLEEEEFKDLKVYSDLPVRSGETGNFSLFGY